MKKLLSILLALCLVLGLLPAAAAKAAAEDTGETVDFVVLSTTDMHGKCWDKNVLTDGNENNTMLRVSIAVDQFRASYGENLLLIDNGDLYQGTPVSTVQLGKITSGESDLPAAMALCLGDIGYDVSVLGNHEFNYPWTTMSGIYAYLESRGVPVVTANLYYDGTDGVHEAGENVFTPYLIKTFEINGTEHKIGVLGFENTDCTRWDVPDNYPGILFSHPDNPERSIAWEAQRYIPLMQAEGCEFIIVSYHSGLGSASGDLVFTQNSEGQVARMIAECEGIDMVIAGHDHSSAYSNTYLQDKNGKDVLVVNGGGTQLTQSVFTFSEDEDGKLQYVVKDTKNLGLSAYAVDTVLKEKLQPYADMAIEYVNQTAGTAVGEWDTSSNYYLEQTDTIDLINEVQKSYGSKYMAEKYDTDEKKAALYAATGLDHIDVDVSAASPVTNNNYYVKPGVITMKTIVQMYKYDNNVLYLLPLTGQQIKDILEQNASTRLKASVKNGTVTYSAIGDNFTNVVFGGLNFTYDMYQPEGSRVVIDGLANGRDFALDQTYVVACNSYHLGNAGCGFGAYTTTDSVWNQNDDLGGSNIQEAILEYIQDLGEISTEPFTWTWKLDYTGSLDAPTELSGAFAAEKVTDPSALENGDRIVIYYDAESTVIGHEKAADDRRLAAVDSVMVGDYISASDKAAIFEIEWIEDMEGRFRLKAEQGYLTAGATGNSLGFSESFDADAGENDCTAWYLTPVEGGYHIMSVGANYNGNHNQAIEWYSGFTTYGVKNTAIYLFNLYKVADTAKRVSALTDGRQYAIYFDEEGLTVSDQEKSGGLDGVTNTVSGDFLMLPVREYTLVVTAHIDGEQIDFETPSGSHLTANPTGNGLKLTAEIADNDCSLWTLVPVEGGFHVMNVGANYNGNHNQALEYYGGKFTTYGVNNTGAYLFNFYELPENAQDEPDEYTVYAVDTAENGALYCYTWDSETGDVNEAWPGEALTPEPECDVDNHPYYIARIDAAKYDHLIFSSSSGQTADLDFLSLADEEKNVVIYLDGSCARIESDDAYYQDVWNYRGDWRTPSCTEPGQYRITGILGSERFEEYGSPIGHSWVELSRTEPTQEADGYALYRCSNCGATRTETLPWIEEGAAWTLYTVDTGENGGELYYYAWNNETQEYRQAWPGEVLTPKADRDVDGHRWYSVRIDSEKYDRVIFHNNNGQTADLDFMALAVDEERNVVTYLDGGCARIESGEPYYQDVWTYRGEWSNPTCTEPGQYRITGVLGGERFEEYGSPLGHSWTELSRTEPTMEADGYILYRCSSCGATRTEVIPMLSFRFEDVTDESKFYYLPVYWAYYHDPQITTGTSDTLFSPGKVCTRGQVVTFLWRAMGCPEPTVTTHNFTDVKETAYYYQAMLWAVETGVTTGTSETTFGPNKEATRGQVVTFLWRALGQPEPTQTTHPFTDVKESAYYYQAMLWAVETGVTSGTSATTFGPNKTATRGHVVTFLYRAVGREEQPG